MCGDAERCCYCEDSLAAEIDHVRPKSLYPGSVFVWSNFLWVCPRCNKLKSDRFGIIKGEQIERVPRGSRAHPPDGDPALIDPRKEDPLDFLWLDLDTFALAPLHGLPGLAFERAEFTWRTLKLNEDALVCQRHNAYYILRTRSSRILRLVSAGIRNSNAMGIKPEFAAIRTRSSGSR
jgi:uncharacterized protein (TIGR02646 family)